jgi:hypothetical protein
VDADPRQLADQRLGQVVMMDVDRPIGHLPLTSSSAARKPWRPATPAPPAMKTLIAAPL